MGADIQKKPETNYGSGRILKYAVQNPKTRASIVNLKVRGAGTTDTRGLRPNSFESPIVTLAAGSERYGIKTTVEPLSALQSRFYGNPNGIRSCRHAQPFKQQRAVHLHCFFAQIKLMRDLFVQQALCHQRQNIKLPR